MSQTLGGIDYNVSKDVGTSTSNVKESESDIFNYGVSDNNLRILYITFAIIVGLFLLWIIIVTITKEDPLKILNQMNDLTAQMQPVSDIPAESSILPTTDNIDLTPSLSYDVPYPE
jgi:hypothetical protein